MRKFSCMNKSEKSRSNFDIDEFWNWNQFYERWRSKKSAIYNACDVDQFQNKFSNWSDFEFDRCLFSCENQNKKIKHLSSFFCCESFWSFFYFQTIFFDCSVDQLWLSREWHLRDMHEFKNDALRSDQNYESFRSFK